jgi:selenide, water dikinase
MITTTTLLNRAGADLAKLPGVHAMTDVTGFGLLGHLLEMCRGSRLGAHLSVANIPLLDNVLALAEAGIVTGASDRNWASYGDHVRFAPDMGKAMRPLLCDPQTSGGLLVSCASDAAAAVLDVFKRHSGEHAAIIGEMVEGEPTVHVDA